MCVCLFAPSRGQPLCFTLLIRITLNKSTNYNILSHLTIKYDTCIYLL